MSVLSVKVVLCPCNESQYGLVPNILIKYLLGYAEMIGDVYMIINKLMTYGVKSSFNVAIPSSEDYEKHCKSIF